MRVQIKQMTKTIAAWILVIGMLVTSIPMNTLAIEGQTGGTSHPSIETTDAAASDNAVDPTLESTDQAGSQTAESISSGTEETPTIDETAPIEGTTTDPAASVEEESTEVHFKVTYHEETPTTDWVYQITYYDENDVEQYYIGRYYIYDQNGTCLSPKDGDSIDDTQKGKITIPAKNEIPENAETIEKYRLNKEDSTLLGFTVTLKDVKEQTLYTIIQSQNAGLKLDDKDPKLTKEQQVIAQKDSDNHPEEEDAKINTATFNYKGIEEVTAEGQTSTEEKKDETQPTEDSTNEATTETTEADQSVNVETDATAETDSENADASQTGEIAEETAAPTTERITEGAALLGATEKKSIVTNRKIDEAVMLLQSEGTNEENSPQITQPQIVLNGDGLAGHTFTYEIKTNADPAVAYNGKYKIIPPDTKEEDLASIQPQQCNNGKIDISNCASGTKIILVNANINTEYNVEDKTNSSDTNNLLHEHSSNTQTINSTSKSVSFGYRTKTEKPVTLTKIWADGKIDHNRTNMDNNNFIKLYYQAGTGDSLVEGEATPKDLGINGSWEIEHDNNDTSGLTVWTYTYSDLPKCDADGTPIEYYAKESNFDISDKYIKTYDGTTITNALKVNTDNEKSDYKATIVWKDKDDSEGKNEPDSRPSADATKNNAFVKGVTIRRSVNGVQDTDFPNESDNSADYITIIPSTKNSSEWEISLHDLPKYDENGNEYTYYIDQTSEFLSETEGDYKYSKKYENVGANGIKSEGLYNGGTLTDTRVETIPFKFQVEWIDGGNTWDRDCNLYLYRYADADGTTVETASPVQGFDKMYFKDGVLYVGDKSVNVDPETGMYTWSYISGTGVTAAALDKYSPNGSVYTYYIKQKDLGNADYKDSYYDKDIEPEHTYITNGGKITNQLEKSESPQITKTWEAKALQGKIGDLKVQLQLQKRYVYKASEKDAQYTAWEYVKDADNKVITTTQGGFSSAVMTKDVGEGTYDGYTKDAVDNTSIGMTNDDGTRSLPAGTKIEYQWVETAIVIEGQEDPNEFRNGQTTISGLTNDNTDVVVKQTYTQSADGTNTEVKNQLIDQTQVNVSKTWSGDDWPEDAVINVKLCREDGKVKDKEGKDVDAIDNDGNPVHSITLSKGNPTESFTNLPRYDADGREIIYYVVEKEIGSEIAGNNTVYHYYDTNYKKITDDITLNDGSILNIRQTNAEIQNVRPGPGGITINVNKRWLDDGDLTHRQTTTMGIFAKADINSGDAFNNDGTLKVEKAETTVDLTDGSAWTQKLSFTPSKVTSYWKLKDGETFENATTTKPNDCPVYGVDGNQQTNTAGALLYWDEEKITETTVQTDYPVYVQKTTTTYDTSGLNIESIVQNWEGDNLYWADQLNQETTTKQTDNPVYAHTSEKSGQKVYLDKDKKETTAAADNAGNPNTPVYVKKMTSKASENDYIALEISVGSAAVKYTPKAPAEGQPESYAWITANTTLVDSSNKAYTSGANASKVVGEVGTTDHLYNVYIGKTDANGMSGYTITNQRKGVQEIDVKKTWNNGNLAPDEQPKAAFFKIYRNLNGTSGTKEDVTAKINAENAGIGKLITDDPDKPSEASMFNLGTAENVDWTIKVPNIASEATSAATEMQAIIKQLPKYDELGRLYQYTISEYAVEDPASTNNNPIIRKVEGGSVKVSVKQGETTDGNPNYVYKAEKESNIQYYDQYSASMQEPTEVSGAQNTNDVFTYQSTNTRSQTFKVSLRKVWQDDGLNHSDKVPFRRADIYFRMYKVPVGSKIGTKDINCENDLLGLSKDEVKQLIDNTDICSQEGGDYRWDTQHNEWYWTCEMDGEFQRYNSEGKEYLYFAVEKSNDFLDYKNVYYNGEVQPNDKNGEQIPTNTEEVFHEKDHLTNETADTGNLLVVHKEGDGLQSNGSVLNVREGDLQATATKVWSNLPSNFNPSDTPTIYMELRRRLVLDEENKIYGAWETVSVKKSTNGSTSFKFDKTDRFDEYGRKYEFDVQEKYYEIYNNIDVALKLSQDANSRFFKVDNNSKSGYSLYGEGCYYKEGEKYSPVSKDMQASKDTTFYTKKVTYNQDDDGEYVKIGENEYVLYQDLLNACATDEAKAKFQSLVRPSQRYSRTEEQDYAIITSDIYLGLDHVPGYKPANQAEGDHFTWTNEYDSNANIRQRVEITVNKTWELPAYANEVPELEFQLWRRIQGQDQSDEQVATAERVKTTEEINFIKDNAGDIIGKTKSESVTFTADQKNNEGDALAYYAPNGKPYVYYVKEVVPGGYLGKVEKKVNDTSTVKTEQGDGSDQIVLQSDDINLEFYKVDSTNHLVFYNQENEKDKTTSYTNTYNGLPVVQNKAIKKWVDQDDKYGMRPTDIDLTLTQSGAGYKGIDGTTERVVAEYDTDGTTVTNNGEWTSSSNKTDKNCDTWEYNFKNDQIKTDSALKDVEQIQKYPLNFPKYGPNGEPFTYTVTEGKANSDSTNKLGSYKQSTATVRNDNVIPNTVTNTITNTLETTSISTKKVWQGTDGVTVDIEKYDLNTDAGKKEYAAELAKHTWIYNDADNTSGAHMDAELENLYNMGVMPTKITFTLQYSDTANPDPKNDSDWTNVSPDISRVFELATINLVDGKQTITWNKFHVAKSMRDTVVTFENLPKYILGNNSSTTNATERKYRIKETSEYAQNQSTTSANTGQFEFKTVTTATNGGSTIVTNEIKLKKVTLDKKWNDGKNYMNTRPDDINFVVDTGTGTETYQLSKAENSVTNDSDNWAKDIWVPNLEVAVTEPLDKQTTATKAKLNDIYNVNDGSANPEPKITKTAGATDNAETWTIENILDTNLKKRTSITASKTWDDIAYDYMYDVIHPESITYELQYSHKEVGSDTWTAWATADASCNISDTNPATQTKVYDSTNKKWPDATWNDLFQYYKFDTTDEALPIRYRVVETKVDAHDVYGYTTTYGDNDQSLDEYTGIVANKATVPDEEKPYDTAGTIIVKNTVDDSASVKLQKSWGVTEADSKAIAVALSGNITGIKSGENNLATIGSATDVGTLQSKGLFPMGIKFQLQYTVSTTPATATNAEWKDLAGQIYTADTPELIYGVLKGVTVYDQQLPKTAADGKTIHYRFVESAVNFTDVTNDKKYVSVESSVTTSETNKTTTENTTLYTVATDSTTTAGTTTITNKIPTGKITVTKSVVDEGNRDNMRDDITVTLQRKQVDNTYTDYATGVLKYNTGTKDWDAITFDVPIYDTKTFTNKSNGSANEWRVVENKVGSSDSLNGYKAKVTYPDNKTYATLIDATDKTAASVNIDNTRVPERFTVTAAKNWADDANNAMNTRPTNSEVQFTLQYSTDKGANWHNVIQSSSGNAAPATLATSADMSKPYYYEQNETDSHSGYYYTYSGTSWTTENGTDAYTISNPTQTVDGLSGDTAKTATWEKIPVHTLKTPANTDGILYFRVVENLDKDNVEQAVTGYKVVSADDITISGATITKIEGQKGVFTAANNATANITISNKLETTSLDLHKTWFGDYANAYTQAMRPDKIKYKIEYTLAGSTNETDWKPLPTGITNDVTVDDTGCFVLDSQKSFTNTDSTGNANTVKTISHLPLKNNAGKKYLYRITEVALLYGTTEVPADLVKSDSKITWTMDSGTNSDFVGTETGNTIGAYKITLGKTTWNDTDKKWETKIQNELETVSVSATKNWVDDGNRDNRQLDLTFSLTQKVNSVENTDFTVTSKDMQLTDKDTSENRQLTVTWTDLPKYSKLASNHTDTKNMYEYIVSEKAKAKKDDSKLEAYVVKNYDTTALAVNTSAFGTTVTNIHDIYTFAISGKKIWDDEIATSDIWCNNTDKANRKPTEVTLTLQYLNASNEWVDVNDATEVTDTTLPKEKTNTGDGADVIYFKYSGTANEDKVRDASGYYIWDATNEKYIPDSSGVYTTDDIDQKAEGADWNGPKWNNLPVYNSQGKLISYRVNEKSSNWTTYYFAQPSDVITGEQSAGTPVKNDTVINGEVTNKLNKIKLVKTDGNNKLKDVQFKLVKKDGDNTAYTGITDSNGEVIFTGLESGTYVITELNTKQGLQLLSAPFEVTIPLSMTETDITNWDKEHADNKVDKTNAVQSDDQNSWSFYQVTYTVTNSANFTMPMTGNKGNWNYGLFALIPFAAVCIIYRRRKKRNTLL